MSPRNGRTRSLARDQYGSLDAGRPEVTAGSLSEDLAVLSNFQIGLRNVLAWQGEARRVIARHSELVPVIEPSLVDGALNEIERLFNAIGAMRERLDAAEGS